MERNYDPIDAVERGLLDAIIAAPATDAPRLVYADWLQARGELHGELITVQCELAGLRRERGREQEELANRRGQLSEALGERIVQLEAVENELLARPQIRWLSSFIEQARRRFGGTMALSRGLLPTTSMAGRSEQLLQWHHGLARFAPFVSRMLVLDLSWDELERLFTAGCLHQLRRLELHGQRYGHQATRERALACAPFACLEKLELHNMSIDEADVRQLFSLSFPSLEALRFEKCALDAGVLEAVAERAPAQLRELELRGSHRYYRDAEVAALAGMGLQALHVRGGYINPNGAQLLRRAIPRCKFRFDQPMQVVG